MKLFLGREQTKLLRTVYTREMIVILKRTVTYPGRTACRLILFSWSIGSTVDLQTEIFLLLFDFRELGISSAPKDPGTSLWSPPGAVLTSSSSVSFSLLFLFFFLILVRFSSVLGKACGCFGDCLF